MIDEKPVITDKMLSLALWVSSHYYAPPGEVISMILPKDEIRVERVLTLQRDAIRPKIRSANTLLLYDALESKAKERRFDQLLGDLAVTKAQLARLLKTPAVTSFVVETLRARRVNVRKREETKPEVPSQKPKLLNLTCPQENASKIVAHDIRDQKFAVHLLHGVTGSGKTEVYAHLIDEVLKSRRSALVLAPEIALANSLAARLSARLGVDPIVIHSDMSPRERNSRIEQATSGKGRLVVGARSAVFTQIAELGLIIVDEEHDPSYKQDSQPRYSGRDVAIKRAATEGVPILLGSATPSMESFAHALDGKYNLIELSDRIDKRPMPEVVMVAPDEPGKVGGRVREEIEKRLKAGEQSLLFINRRGAARYIQCEMCGHVFECKNCSLSLVWHSGAKRLDCHTCGYSEPASTSCPACGEAQFFMGGFGSEKIESEIRQLFPTARVARMDRDTTSRRRAAEKILGGVENREIDILIGTQMVTKGHDYHGITLACAVSADDSLHIPDFRAGERTFQLITQAAGRAGRGEVAGLVVVQTWDENHHSLTSAATHDYRAFYEAEAPSRKAAGYPPFMRIAMIRIDAPTVGKGEVYLQMADRAILEAEKKAKGLLALGPTEAVVFKTKNRYHWRILLKAQTHSIIRAGVTAYFDSISRSANHTIQGVNAVVDMDPV